MEKLELEIAALSQSVTQSQSYAIVLKEQEGLHRRLPIVIGIPEAQAIAVALENMKPSRPLTHDLVKGICSEFDIKVHEVIICNLIEGVFHAKLICEQNGNVVEVDSRTSDALALAVRFRCPIYTYEFILDSAGIVLEGADEQRTPVNEPIPQKSKSLNDFRKHSVKKLNSMLAEAISNEDYELAAYIRDEIETRID